MNFIHGEILRRRMGDHSELDQLADGVGAAPSVLIRTLESIPDEVLQPLSYEEMALSGRVGVLELTAVALKDALVDIPFIEHRRSDEWIEAGPLDDSFVKLVYPQDDDQERARIVVFAPVYVGPSVLALVPLDLGFDLVSGLRVSASVSRIGCIPGFRGEGETLSYVCLSGDCEGECNESWQSGDVGGRVLAGCKC